MYTKIVHLHFRLSRAVEAHWLHVKMERDLSIMILSKLMVNIMLDKLMEYLVIKPDVNLELEAVRLRNMTQGPLIDTG